MVWAVETDPAVEIGDGADQYDPVYEDDSNPAAWLEGMSLPAFCLLIVLGLFYLAVDALWNRWNR